MYWDVSTAKLALLPRNNPLYLSKEAFFEGLGLYVSPGTSLCLCHCSPRGEATDFACWIISLRLAADAAENCYRMNSAVPKLGSKDSSTEHPCSPHCSPRGEATDFACWIISLD